MNLDTVRLERVCAMDSTTDEIMVETDYEAPTVIELGSLVEVTNGSGAVDTADMKQWYN